MTTILVIIYVLRRGRKRKRMPDEGAADEADLSPRDKFRFKIQTFLVMIDSLLAELKKMSEGV